MPQPATTLVEPHAQQTDLWSAQGKRTWEDDLRLAAHGQRYEILGGVLYLSPISTSSSECTRRSACRSIGGGLPSCARSLSEPSAVNAASARSWAASDPKGKNERPFARHRGFQTPVAPHFPPPET